MAFDYTLRYPEIVEMLKSGKTLTLTYDVMGNFAHAQVTGTRLPIKYIRKNYVTRLYKEYKFHRVDDGDYAHLNIVKMCLDPDCDFEG